MKKIKDKAYLAVAVLVCLGTAAQARQNQLRHEDVVVEKGQALREDIATDKSITINGLLEGDAVSVGGASVTVNGELLGDLVAMGGTVSVTGAVKGDVASVGGPIEITGKVTGNVASVGGRVTLAGTGQVDGDISSVGGSVVKGEKAVLKGEMRSFDIKAVRTVLPRVMKFARYASSEKGRDMEPWMIGGLIGLGLAILFSILATGIILLLLPAVFFPKNVENAAAAITGDMWKTCGIGALILMGLFPGLIMMLVSVLGIPLVPFALMLVAAAAILGLSAFSVVLQGRFFEGIKKTGPVGLPGKVAVGYAVMAGLLFFGKLLPLIGGVLSLIGFMLMAFGVMLGLGAAWMTRMGNRAAVPSGQPYVPPQVPPVQPHQPQ